MLKAGSFLIVKGEKPEKSDVIITLGGSNIIRTDYSVRLFKEGYSKHLLLSGGIIGNGDNRTHAEVMYKEAKRLRVPDADIIIEDESKSTYQNALYTKTALINLHYKSAIIVTSNYHMKRARLVFKKVFNGTGIDLRFSISDDKNFKPNNWWTDAYSRKIVITEYAKLLGYLVKGRL